MDCTSATVTIGDVDESKDLRATDASATFRVRLERGPAELRTTLRRADGDEHGAYYAYVRLLSGD